MDAETIMSALREQVECYRRLAKLAEAQHEHVRQGRTEELLHVLGQRQEALDRIGDLERTIGPARRDWAAAALSTAQRQSADAMLAETRQLLEVITSADRDDALLLQQRKLNLGKQINAASTARQVNRNYGISAYGAKRPALDVQR